MVLKHYYLASNYNISFDDSKVVHGIKKTEKKKKGKVVDVFRKTVGCILLFCWGNLERGILILVWAIANGE